MASDTAIPSYTTSPRQRLASPERWQLLKERYTAKVHSHSYPTRMVSPPPTSHRVSPPRHIRSLSPPVALVAAASSPLVPLPPPPMSRRLQSVHPAVRGVVLLASATTRYLRRVYFDKWMCLTRTRHGDGGARLIAAERARDRLERQLALAEQQLTQHDTSAYHRHEKLVAAAQATAVEARELQARLTAAAEREYRMEMTIERLQRQVEQGGVTNPVKDRLSEAEAQVDALRRERDALRRELHEARAEGAKRIGVAESLQTQRAGDKGTIAELQKSLARRDAVIAGLRETGGKHAVHSLEEVEGSRRMVIETEAQCQRVLLEGEAMRARRGVDYTDVARRLELKQKELSEWEGRLHESEMMLQAEKEGRYQAKERELMAEVCRREAALTARENHIKAMHEDGTTWEAKYREKEAEAHAALRRAREIEKEADEALQRSREKEAEAESRCREKEAELRGMGAVVEALRTEHGRAGKALDEVIGALRSELCAVAKADAEQALKDKAELERTVQEKEAEIVALRETVDRLRLTLQEPSAELGAAREREEALQGQLGEAKAALEKEHSRAEHLENVSARAAEREEEAVQQRNELRLEVGLLQERVARLAHEVEEAREQLVVEKDAVAQASNRAEAVQGRYEAVQTELSEVRHLLRAEREAGLEVRKGSEAAQGVLQELDDVRRDLLREREATARERAEKGVLQETRQALERDLRTVQDYLQKEREGAVRDRVEREALQERVVRVEKELHDVSQRWQHEKDNAVQCRLERNSFEEKLEGAQKDLHEATQLLNKEREAGMLLRVEKAALQEKLSELRVEYQECMGKLEQERGMVGELKAERSALEGAVETAAKVQQQLRDELKEASRLRDEEREGREAAVSECCVLKEKLLQEEEQRTALEQAAATQRGDHDDEREVHHTDDHQQGREESVSPSEYSKDLMVPRRLDAQQALELLLVEQGARRGVEEEESALRCAKLTALA
eukprot:Sspe_Gene.32810::Locus_16065_Transcript_3_4_Confidence_0.400_Length_2999::g.32810::m.32810